MEPRDKLITEDPLDFHPHLCRLERYWRSLRHAQKVPARTSLNPAQIDSVLPNTFLVQRVAPGVARFRVAGQLVHQTLKMDPRGMPIATLFQHDAKERLRNVIEQAFQLPAIVRIPLLSQGNLMRPNLRASMLLLPMSDQHGATTRLLGALVTDGAVGSRPRRFCVSPDHDVRLDPLGPHLATNRPIVVTPPQRPAPTRGQPNLRLVVNNG